MKALHGEVYEICVNEAFSRIEFRGALRLCGTSEYTPILEILRGALRNASGPIVLDLRELDFLNSSGITMFSRFVMEARDQADVDLRIVASTSVPWHARSLRNLERLMPQLSVRYE